MPKRNEPKLGTVTVELDGEVVAVFKLRELPRDAGTEIDSLVSPEVNMLKLKEMLVYLGEHTEQSYYMARVRYLSKQAREEIKRALEDEDNPPAPF